MVRWICRIEVVFFVFFVETSRLCSLYFHVGVVDEIGRFDYRNTVCYWQMTGHPFTGWSFSIDWH